MTTQQTVKYIGGGLGVLMIGVLIYFSTLGEVYRIIALVTVGAIIVCTTIFLAFAGGNLWAAYLMSKGAGIALKSQESDDKRDIALIQAQSASVEKLLPLVYKTAQQQQPPRYEPPMLLSGADSFEEGDFTIRGLDDR